MGQLGSLGLSVEDVFDTIEQWISSDGWRMP